MNTSLIFFGVFFAECLPNPATVSELPIRSVSKDWQAFSTNTTTF